MQTTNVKKQETAMQNEIMQNAMVITKLNMSSLHKVRLKSGFL